jgi:hypothetical protein
MYLNVFVLFHVEINSMFLLKRNFTMSVALTVSQDGIWHVCIKK